MSERWCRPWARVAFVILVSAGLAPLATTALAAKRVALLPPEQSDPADAPVRAKITKALKQHKIQAVAGAPVKKAVKKSGRPSSDEDYVNLARKLKVEGVLEAIVSETGSKRRVEIVIRSASDGGVVGRETFSAKGPPKKLAAVVARSFWKKLGSAFKRTAPPPKEEASGGLAARDLPPGDLGSGGSKSEPAGDLPKSPEPEARETADATDKKDKEDKTESKEEGAEGSDEKAAKVRKDGESADGEDEKPARAGRRRPPAEGAGETQALRFLEVELDLRYMKRLFQYVPLAAATHYYLNFVPLVGGKASWFPITYAGIFAQGEFTGALKTGIYPTVTREIVVGAQGRVPFSMGQVGASAAYFQHVFLIQDTPSTTDPVRSTLPTPDTAYQGARFAVNARFRFFDRVLLGVEGAYRLVTNPGQGPNLVRSTQYFPNGIVTAGVDGGAFVGVGILPFLEIRAGVDYRRYVLGRLQGATINASGGATDDYLAFSLGVVGVLGGK